MEKIIIKQIELHRFKKFREKIIQVPGGFCLLAGANNSGKSTFMQAFAVWEFCKSVIQIEHGVEGLLGASIGKQGVGVNGEDFLPLNIPSLKHLWTNLRIAPEKDQNGNTEPDGYTLWIEVRWDNNKFEESRHLRFALSLANERLFIKTSSSNVTASEIMPKIAYIPPFAGILNREPYHTKAMRSRLIGQGLSGSVMRNTLLELYKENLKTREHLKAGLDRIPKTALSILRATDRWEHLLELTRNLFQIEIVVHDFNEDYHSSIKTEYWKGKYNQKKTKFTKHKGFNSRDIMVEGSGLLQLLNVISLSLDASYQVIFLDEPDAHLHPSLQFSLVKELNMLAEKYDKQILFATHSAELIASQPPEKILKFKNGSIAALSSETQKIGLIVGLGSEYSPLINTLQRSKIVVFVENDSDSRLLKTIAEKLGSPISDDVVMWPWPGKHNERLVLFTQLKREISGLRGISIRDRDGQDFNTITTKLKDNNFYNYEQQGMTAMTWRYRYIETYLLVPDAIARAADVDPADIFEHARQMGVNLENYCPSEIIPGLREFQSKELLTEGSNCLANKYKFNKYDVASNMTAAEIHQDLKELISQICSLSNSAGAQLGLNFTKPKTRKTDAFG